MSNLRFGEIYWAARGGSTIPSPQTTLHEPLIAKMHKTWSALSSDELKPAPTYALPKILFFHSFGEVAQHRSQLLRK